MTRWIACVAGLTFVLGTAAVTAAGTIALHQTQSNPETEGWGRLRPFSNVATFHVVDDQGNGVDAWAVDDNGGSSGAYGVTLTRQQLNQAATYGGRRRAASQRPFGRTAAIAGPPGSFTRQAHRNRIQPPS